MSRVLDVVLAGLLLLVTAPLLALAALAIRVESRGPVFYRQLRVGRDGESFELWKLRTMVPGAESIGAGIYVLDGDPRITRVGRMLRRTKIDELPQLWNVIRGDMSFVGPRPERPFFVDQLAREIPFYQQRHAVKPGVTGWAQVKYQYGSTVEDAMEKLRYDLYYIKHLSIAFDLSIVFDTVKVILFGRGK